MKDINPQTLKHHYLTVLGLIFLSLLLSACGTNTMPEMHVVVRPASHLITVPLEDSLASLEARYDGNVITSTDSHAVLTVNLSQEQFSTLSDLAEHNTDSFQSAGQSWISGRSTAWAGGRSTAWAGGRSTAWAGGRSTAWAGGEFVWMPENTQVWQQINLEQGHMLAQDLGLDIKVAVIDTGVDLEHPALIEALAPASEWYDFVDNDSIPQEEGELGVGGYGHGTNVAGIVRQIAPRATILPIRVLNAEGWGYTSDLVKAIDHAVEMGADVINLSLGSSEKSSALREAMRKASRHGVLVVASVGNDDSRRLTHPARGADESDWQISVTSVDDLDQKSSFANYNEGVEISAPGENIYGPAPGSMMTAWSGTSMAAPIVSGMLALALGEADQLDLKFEELTKMIQDYSYDFYNNDSNEDFKDELGKGRVDVEAFIHAVMEK